VKIAKLFCGPKKEIVAFTAASVPMPVHLYRKRGRVADSLKNI